MILPKLVYLATVNDLTPDVWKANFDQITRWWNEHDNGSRVWDRCVFLGRTDASIAASGQVGQANRNYQGANAAATTVWGNLASLSLPAGDFDVSCNVYLYRNGATLTGDTSIAISLYSGNTTTDHTNGDNVLTTTMGSGNYAGLTVVNYQINASVAQTVYMKHLWVYSAGTPVSYGRISYRRMT